jgi:osmotically-inducible protein OsmY
MQTAPLPPQPAATGRVAEADFMATIKILLATTKNLTAHQIAVLTRAVIVELSGFSATLLAQQRAEEIALALRGVRDLHSTLTVCPAAVPDAELQHAVARALADDPATDNYHVHCLARRGMVALSGLVKSGAEKQLVLRVVQGVRGVCGLEAGQLMIRGGGILNSDEEITTRIRKRLDEDLRVNGALVVVRTYERVVYLSGTVGTAAEKDRLMAMAYHTGTTRVDARDLFVAYWALGRVVRYAEFAFQTDAAIGAGVRATLRFNPRVRSAETLVQVRDGVVTLAGTVRNLRTRQEAEQDARQVVGVAGMHNLLKVRPARLVPDEDLSWTITSALARDPYVGHRVFGVQVHSGQALLTGTVDTHFELEQAGEVASGVSGVVGVNNRLDVVGEVAGTAPDSALRYPDPALTALIQTRHGWSAGRRDQEVTMQVANDQVTRTGTVDTWLGRQLAAQKGREASAHEVSNHLPVLPTDPRISHKTAPEHGIEA